MRAPAVSASRHDVLIQFAMKGDPDTADKRVQPVEEAVGAARTAHPDVTIEQFGDASANKYFSYTIIKDMKRAEWTVVPVAIGILLVVFGALVAALLPVVLALTAFMAANGLLAVIKDAMHVDQSTSSVMLLISEMYRVPRPGGVLLVADFRPSGRRLTLHPGGRAMRDHIDLEALTSAAGFRVETRGDLPMLRYVRAVR